MHAAGLGLGRALPAARRPVLGLSIDGRQSELRFNKPSLPDFVHELHIDGLQVGRGTVDLRIVRWGDDVAVSLVRKSGEVRLVVAK